MLAFHCRVFIQRHPGLAPKFVERQVAVLRRVLLDRPLVSGYEVRNDFLIVNGVVAPLYAMANVFFLVVAESHLRSNSR